MKGKPWQQFLYHLAAKLEWLTVVLGVLATLKKLDLNKETLQK